MKIEVKSFAFVFHPVTDVARAREFYEGLLGFKVGLNLEFQPGKFWVEFDMAGQTLAISNAMPGVPASSLNLEVADLDEAMSAYRATGAELAFEMVEFPGCRIFGIKDPDGNQIGLHQMKPRS